MKRFFTAILGKSTQHTATKCVRRSTSLLIEALERREVPTTADFYFNEGRVVIQGDADDDHIVITQEFGTLRIEDRDGKNQPVLIQQRDAFGNAVGSPDARSLRLSDPARQSWRVEVNAGGGNDKVEVISHFNLWHYQNISSTNQNVFALLNGEGGNDTLSGASLGDTLNGGADTDWLFGNGGDDSLDGGTGSDLIYGHEGDDVLTGGWGRDTIEGGAGRDWVRGDKGNDFLMADTWFPTPFSGNDTLEGGKGDDSLFGGAGNDFLCGGADNDEIHGGAGNDMLFGNAGSDRLFGGEHNDFLYGGDQYTHLYNAEQGQLLYGIDNDSLFGESGDDRLWGGFGADLLKGGAGADALDGGHGADTIYFDIRDRDSLAPDWLDRIIKPIAIVVTRL